MSQEEEKKWREHMKSVESLIDSNNEASHLHRMAYGKAEYNQAIDDASKILEKLWETWLPDRIYQEIIKKLQSLKK